MCLDPIDPLGVLITSSLLTTRPAVGDEKGERVENLGAERRLVGPPSATRDDRRQAHSLRRDRAWPARPPFSDRHFHSPIERKSSTAKGKIKLVSKAFGLRPHSVAKSAFGGEWPTRSWGEHHDTVRFLSGEHKCTNPRQQSLCARGQHGLRGAVAVVGKAIVIFAVYRGRSQATRGRGRRSVRRAGPLG